MQILNYIQIKNFLGTKERFVDFQKYNSPLFITGENAKGKTTIMRATFFALTAEDAFFGGQNLDAIINDHSNSMEIELSLQNKGNEYIINIKKERKKGLDVTIQENGKHILPGKLLKDAKSQLVELFGNPTSMLNTYFMFGDTASDFVNATPTQRLNTIVKISDTFKKYESISNNAKVMAGKLEIDKNKQIGTLDFLNKQVLQLEESKTELENSEVLKTNKEEIIKFEKDIELLKKDIELLKNINEKELEIKDAKNQDIDSINKKLKDNEEQKEQNVKIKEQKDILLNDKVKITKELNEKSIELTKLKGELNTKKSLKEEKNKNKEIVNKEHSKLFSFSSLEEAEEYKEKTIKAQKEVENKGNTEATSIKVLEGDIERINKEIKDITGKLSDTEKLFKENNHCPLCYNELTEKSLSNYKEYLASDRKTKEDKVKELLSKIELHKSNRTKLGIEWTNFKKDLENLELYYTFVKNAKTNLKIKEELENLDKEIAILEEKIVKLDKEVKEFSDKENELTKKINEIVLKIVLSNEEEQKLRNILEVNKNLKYKLEEISSLEKKVSKENKGKNINELETELYTNTKKVNEYKDISVKRDNILSQVEKSKKEKEDTLKLIEVINKDIKEYETLKFFFGKNGVQKQQIKQLLKQIELETNGIINRFFEDISVKFNYDNKGIALIIQRRVFNNNGGFELKEDTLKNFSDAQQEVLTVLLKLSFSKIVQHLNNTPLNILFLNETFNTLSKEKESELINTLNIYNKDYHLFFITHNLDLVSNFDQQNILHL